MTAKVRFQWGSSRGGDVLIATAPKGCYRFLEKLLKEVGLCPSGNEDIATPLKKALSSVRVN
jgi:hypothetical protein